MVLLTGEPRLHNPLYTLLVAVRSHPPGFGRAHVVHRLLQFLYNMEAVQNVQRLAALLANHPQVPV